LADAVLPAHEGDTWMDWNTLAVENPTEFGTPRHPFKMKRQLKTKVTVMWKDWFKNESSFLISRYKNEEYGFFVEHIKSLGDEDSDLKPVPKGFTRMETAAYNLWLPTTTPDGKGDACVLVQVSKLDIGVSVPAFLLKQIGKAIAPGIIKSFRDSAKFSLPGSAAQHAKFRQKRQADKEGLYAALDRVQAVGKSKLPSKAGGRVCAERLPDSSIFELPEPF